MVMVSTGADLQLLQVGGEVALAGRHWFQYHSFRLSATGVGEGRLLLPALLIVQLAAPLPESAEVLSLLGLRDRYVNF